MILPLLRLVNGRSGFAGLARLLFYKRAPRC